MYALLELPIEEGVLFADCAYTRSILPRQPLLLAQHVGHRAATHFRVTGAPAPCVQADCSQSRFGNTRVGLSVGPCICQGLGCFLLPPCRQLLAYCERIRHKALTQIYICFSAAGEIRYPCPSHYLGSVRLTVPLTPDSVGVSGQSCEIEHRMVLIHGMDM
jgi:hypothetical protein